MKGINIVQVVLLSMSRNILIFMGVLGNNLMLVAASMIGYVILENMINRAYYDAGVKSVTAEKEE